jgi:hypothetical protein
LTGEREPIENLQEIEKIEEIKKLLEYLKKKHGIEHSQDLIGKCEPIDILELIEKDEHIDNNEVAEFAKEFYKLDKNNDYSLHKNLLQVSNNIIATNYDDAFEKAASSQEINVVFAGRDKKLAAFIEKDDPAILKLHGSITDGDSMIILPSNYRKLYEDIHEDAKRVIFHLGNFFANKTILFLGYSMGEFQINHIFRMSKDSLASIANVNIL